MGVDQYFFIDLSHLKRRKIFGFKLFIHNPHSTNTHLFLEANSPLDQEREDLLNMLVAKGGILCVQKKQQRSFLHSQGLSVYEVASLAQMCDSSPREIDDPFAKKEKQETKTPALNIIAQKSFDSGDFLPFIEAARLEICSYDQRTSHTQSLAMHFARELLIEDNELNRIVALSFFLAKTIDVEDPQSLSDLVCAGYLAHIGKTQAPLSNYTQPQIKMDNKQQKWHQRHGAFSQHLLRKSGVDLSERCLKIIEQHHERVNGSGFPYQLRAQSIEPLALILGALDHIFDYHTGRVTGAPMPIAQVVRHIQKRDFLPGLELEFGEAVIDGVGFLLGKKTG